MMKQTACLLKEVYLMGVLRVKVSTTPGSTAEFLACPPFQTSCCRRGPYLNCTFLEECNLMGCNAVWFGKAPRFRRTSRLLTTRCYNQERRNCRSHRCENLKPSSHATFIAINIIIVGGELEIQSRECCYASVDGSHPRQMDTRMTAATRHRKTRNAHLDSNPVRMQHTSYRTVVFNLGHAKIS
jgi:hypothetical protein